MIDRRATVARLVLEHPAAAAVLHRHRIDACCEGDVPFEDACRARELDPEEVGAELDRAIAPAVESDPRGLSTPDLIAHLVGAHHAHLRRTLPLAVSLAAKIARVHGEQEPHLHELELLVAELARVLGAHLDEEEADLFPALLAGEAAGLAAMQEDHREVGSLLARIQDTARGYAPPEWACDSYRALLGNLRDLEADTLRHFHIENHELARSIAGEPGGAAAARGRGGPNPP